MKFIGLKTKLTLEYFSDPSFHPLKIKNLPQSILCTKFLNVKFTVTNPMAIRAFKFGFFCFNPVNLRKAPLPQLS